MCPLKSIRINGRREGTNGPLSLSTRSLQRKQHTEALYIVQSCALCNAHLSVSMDVYFTLRLHKQSNEAVRIR